jgi:hypothetical protein
MGYAIAWVDYVVAACALVGIYWRFFEGFLPQPWGVLLRVLLLAVLFTPWIIDGADAYMPAPACIAVLFGVLSHSPCDTFAALIPIVVVSLAGVGVLLIRTRKPRASAEPSA